MVFKMISFNGLHSHGLWFTSCSRFLVRTWLDHKSSNNRFSVPILQEQGVTPGAGQALHYAHAPRIASKFKVLAYSFCDREIEELKVSVGWQSKLILYSIFWHQ